MTKESAERSRISRLLEGTTGPEWQRFNPEFTERIQTVLKNTLASEETPLRTISKPLYSQEAHAMTSFNFFDGQIKRVVAGEHLGDDLMKELMIESSSNTEQWLKMRKMLPRQQYNVVTNIIGSTTPQHAGEAVQSPLPKEHQELLKVKLAPMLDILAKRLPATNEDFRMEMAANLAIPFSGDPEEILAKAPNDRQVANVITAFCFRNTSLESLHGGDIPPNEASIVKIKKEADHNLKNWLMMMDRVGDTPLYRAIVHNYWQSYCRGW